MGFSLDVSVSVLTVFFQDSFIFALCFTAHSHLYWVSFWRHRKNGEEWENLTFSGVRL